MSSLYLISLLPNDVCVRHVRHGAAVCDREAEAAPHDVPAPLDVLPDHAFPVADNFGVFAYAAVLFVLTVWWSNEWGEATACPYTHLEDVLDGKADVRVAALKIWAQLTGGVLIFR